MDRHVATLGYIILILSQPVFAHSPWYCIHSGVGTPVKFIVFSLTLLGLESTIYHTRDGHANHTQHTVSPLVCVWQIDDINYLKTWRIQVLFFGRCIVWLSFNGFSLHFCNFKLYILLHYAFTSFINTHMVDQKIDTCLCYSSGVKHTQKNHTILHQSIKRTPIKPRLLRTFWKLLMIHNLNMWNFKTNRKYLIYCIWCYSK